MWSVHGRSEGIEESTHLGRAREKWPHLSCDAIWMIHVIVIPVDQKVAARRCDGCVAFLADGHTSVIEVKHAHNKSCASLA